MIRKTDGTGVVETVSAADYAPGPYLVSVSLEEIAAAGVVVGNPATEGEAKPFSLTVNTVVDVPRPQLALPVPAVALELHAGQEVSASVPLENQGDEGSVLHFLGSVWSEDPTDLFPRISAGEKSIAGSTLQGSPTTYAPGANLALELMVYNGGQDEEWLTRLTLTFPAGVSLVHASPFVGGSLGDLVWSGTAGDGVTTNWEGTYGPQDYGVIQEGESATATLDLAVAASFSGPLVLSGTLTGDQFGAAPHSLPVSITLEAQESPLHLLEPSGRFAVAMGSALQVVWEHQDDLGTVEIMCSRDGGSSWESLGQMPAQDGAFSWAVDGPPSFDCLLRLDAPPGVPGPTTEAGFTIYPPSSWLACASAGGLLAQGQGGVLNLVGQGPPLEPGTMQAWLVVEHDGDGYPGLVTVTAEVTEDVSPVPGHLGPTALTGVVPNPFNPATAIAFRLAGPGLVRLDILDVRGRLVRSLIQDRYAAGSHEVRWDGRDDRGQAVAAGVYLTRMQAPGYTATRKMVLAK
nr:FlgD immunoglobulin-like domain containing protein [Candidatus Krumholzibacteria bacterium]